MTDGLVTVTESREIAEGVHLLAFETEREVPVRAGQFANVGVGDGAHLLRRPIAICKANGREITICFQQKGEGTRLLAAKKPGDKISALLPLGNGFSIGEKEQKIALVGGGVGIFPMVSVLREYAARKEIFSYIGFRNRNAVCCLDELEKSARLSVVTDDGSYGAKMNAVQTFVADMDMGKVNFDLVLACGPTPMLRALKEAVGGKIPCFVSVEERMGCGIGACLVCVCNRTDGSRARVCKDGPVFDANTIEL